MNLNRRATNTDTVLGYIKNLDRRCFSSKSIFKNMGGQLNIYQIADGLRQLQREGKIEKYNKRNWVLSNNAA